LLIEGSYLVGVGVYVELSGAIKDDLKDVQPYLANFWSRSQLPKQPLSFTFGDDQASLLLESGQPGPDVPDVQSAFDAEVYAGVVSQSSGKGGGSGIVYASIQDLFGNKTRIDLAAFSWTYSPETRLLILDISPSSGEPRYTLRSTLRSPGVTLMDELNEAEKKIHEAPIALLTPAGATHGGPPFTVKVIGTGFRPDSAVLWNGSVRTTTYVGPSQLSAAITAADIANAGLVAVAVTTPGPAGGTSAPATFTIK
jgi:hypothetical protein